MTYDKIRISNLEVFAHHGVFSEENRLGQKFILSAILYTDTRKAGMEDCLDQSIHYGEVSHMMKTFVETHTFQLLETVVERLAEKMLLEIPGLEKVSLELKKPWAPIGLHVETVSVEIQRAWHTVYIALGSNIGDRKAFLESGIEKIRDTKGCQVLRVSDFIETPPYGVAEQEDFLNGAMSLRTLLLPYELMKVLQEIEKASGREKTIRWGPRTLDLDILLYDDIILDTEELKIPHEEMHKRDFVLKPLKQIAPYLRHPILQETIERLSDKVE